MKLKNITPMGPFFSITLTGQVLAVFLPVDCECILQEFQVVGRRAWTSKCFEAFRGEIQGNKNGCPTFVFVDENGKILNPRNWFAPTNTDADCDYLDGYQIEALCLP